MAFSPIAYIAPNYRDYKNWWLKAYEPGTVNPKVMSDNDTGTPTTAKYEINKDGFLISSGGDLVVPHIDGEYDLYIFPTEAEADANDTINALRVADDIDPSGRGSGNIDNTNIANYTNLIFNDVLELKDGTKTAAGASVTLNIGDIVETLGYYNGSNKGRGVYKIVPGGTGVDDGGSYIDLNSGLQAQLIIGEFINIEQFGARDAEDSAANIQAAQNFSEQMKSPIDFSGLSDVRFSGGITYSNWLHWKGAGRLNTIFTPLSKTEADVGGNWWVDKADPTTSVTFFMMEDFGVDGEWAGGFPAAGQFLGWATIRSDGSNDENIFYQRLHFVDIPFDVAGAYVIKDSGGTVNNINMLFCSGGTNHIGIPNRNSNMFKTMHGTIDGPGSYGQYPITNITSFGNTCTHMRSLCDFKRGSRKFYHDNSEVIDNSDVCSISVDGARDGVIGADNTGYQTEAFADAKNFYEIQGENIEVLGGTWYANDRAGVVAGLLVTDYVYPAESTPGVYDSNPSVNVNCKGFTVSGIATTQSAVRYINTKSCDVRNIAAFSVGFAAVSMEYVSGRVDSNGVPVEPQGNTVDDIKERDCTWALSVSPDYPSAVLVGVNINDANGQSNILIENSLSGEPPILPLYTPEELNINRYFEVYNGLSDSPLGFTAGSATRNVQSIDKPFGVLKSLESEDTDASSVQATTYEVSIPCKEGEIFFFTISTKLGTSTRSSINVQEFTDVGFISNSYITLNATTDWGKRVRRYKVQDPSATRIIINLLPAANSNVDSSFIGSSYFADLRISKRLNNY